MSSSPTNRSNISNDPEFAFAKYSKGGHKATLSDPTGGPSYKRDLEEASETKEIESRKAVLCNDDILRLIFPYLLPTAERGPSAVGRESIALAGMRKTLLNLLYTCKAFAEPALDVLWSHMDQVVPLLKILPTFKEEQGIYGFHQPILTAHLDRFRSYARRIRSLYLAPIVDIVIAPEAYLQLARLHTDTFLPGLVSLYVMIGPGNVNGSLNPLFYCTSPHLSCLRLLNIIDDNADRSARALLISLVTLYDSPRLGEMELAGQLSIETLEHLSHFPNLHTVTLHLPMLQLRQSLPTLAALPNLSTLNIHVKSKAFAFTQLGPMALQTQIPSLRILRLYGYTRELSELLELASKQPLESLELTYAEPPSDGELRLVVHKLEGMRNLRTIRIARRVSSPAVIGPHLVYPFPKAFLSSFRTLPSLTRLEIEDFPGLVKDMEFQRSFTKPAWSNLEVLHLPYFVQDGAPSVLALGQIARCCPNLTLLKIRIDTQVHDLAMVKAEAKRISSARVKGQGGALQGHGLKRLFLGRATMVASMPMSLEEVLAISDYLDVLFPHLQPVRVYDPPSEGEREWVSGLRTLQESYRRIREEARANNDP